MKKRHTKPYSASPAGFAFILLVFLLNTFVSPPRTWAAGGTALDKAVTQLAAKLVERGNLVEQPVLIGPTDFYDAQSGLSLPFALWLRERMLAEMNKCGVRTLLPGVDEDQYMILQGTWQRQKNDLYLNMKVMKVSSAGPEAVAAESARVPFEDVDPKLLVPERESWARFLVRKLESNAADQNRRTVHLRNFKIVRPHGASVDSEGYFSGWLRSALNESRLFQPFDQQRRMRGIPIEVIRDRATETRPDDENAAATGLTSKILAVESELSGRAWIHEERRQVEIQITVKQSRGTDFSSATADIPSDLFPSYIIKPPAPSVLPPTPLPTVNKDGNVSIKGLTLQLTTSRGEEMPYYKEGEEVRFITSMNRAAWLYLFDLNSAGRACLIYPVDPATGRLIQSNRLIVEPGKPLILPEDGASYEMVASEPFGKDTVWAVASETSLKLPEELTGEWENSQTLVKRVRAQGLSSSSGYAESRVELVTGP